jgi:hypothetical protein
VPPVVTAEIPLENSPLWNVSIGWVQRQRHHKIPVAVSGCQFDCVLVIKSCMSKMWRQRRRCTSSEKECPLIQPCPLRLNKSRKSKYNLNPRNLFRSGQVTDGKSYDSATSKCNDETGEKPGGYPNIISRPGFPILSFQ